MNNKLLKIFTSALAVFLGLVVTGCKEHKHGFGEWKTVKEASCIEDGLKERVCSCGEKETDIIEALGHSGGIATCQNKAVCDVCKNEYGELADHEFDDEWTIDLEPTCLIDGERSRHCLTEGCAVKSDRETVYAIGHKGGKATCEKRAVCDACGNEYGEILEHSFSSDYTIDVPATCISDGKKSRHCLNEGCTECIEETTITALGHEWIDNKTSKHPCSRCDESIDVLTLSEDGTTVIGLTEYGKTIDYIAIPEGVTTITMDSFYNCDIDSLEIPTTLTTFGEDSFWATTVSKLYIKDLKKYCETNARISDNNNPLDAGADLYLNGVLVEDLIIPDDITSIVPIEGCGSIKTITLGKEFTTLINGMFTFSNLTTIILNENTTFVDYYVIFELEKLEKLIVTNPDITFGTHAINDCPNLRIIEYNGTIEKWKGCVEYRGISDISPDCLVYCTDGICDIEGNIVK